ncbi:hypothetical protein PUN28_010571 [Cardiocondyla obscurior]|uniref:Uncharacterized protein n=1 Tax=Cardiocondyla obscurior TaxID=286306 RepID=A0AAW2FGV9_9HYME
MSFYCKSTIKPQVLSRSSVNRRMVARRILIREFVLLEHRCRWYSQNYTETGSLHCRLSLPTYLLDRKSLVHHRLILHLPCMNILARFVSDSQSIHEMCCLNHRKKTWFLHVSLLCHICDLPEFLALDAI